MSKNIFNIQKVIDELDLRPYEAVTLEHLVLKLLESSDVAEFFVHSGLKAEHLKFSLQNQINLAYDSSHYRKFRRSLSSVEEPSTLYVLLKILSLNSWTNQYLSRNLVNHLSLFMYMESQPDMPADVLMALDKYKYFVEVELKKNPNANKHDFINFGWDDGDLDLDDETLVRVSSVIKTWDEESGFATAYIEEKEVRLEFEILRRMDKYSVSIVETSLELDLSTLKLLEFLIKDVLDRGEDLPF